MNEQKATEKLEALNKAMLTRYCPWLRRNCFVNCMAYNCGASVQLNGCEWKVYPPTCTSPLISGELDVDCNTYV